MYVPYVSSLSMALEEYVANYLFEAQMIWPGFGWLFDVSQHVLTWYLILHSITKRHLTRRRRTVQVQHYVRKSPLLGSLLEVRAMWHCYRDFLNAFNVYICCRTIATCSWMSSSPWTMLCSASAGKHRARRVNISTNNTRCRQTTLDKVSIFMAKTKVYFLCASHWTICNTWCCRLPYFFSISLPFLSGQYAFLVVFLFCILFKYLYPVMFHLILFSFFFCQMLPSFANTHSMLLILKPVSRQTTVTKCTEGQETCLVLGIQSEKTHHIHTLLLCSFVSPDALTPQSAPPAWTQLTSPLTWAIIRVSTPAFTIRFSHPSLSSLGTIFHKEKSDHIFVFWKTLASARSFKFLSLKYKAQIIWSRSTFWPHLCKSITFHEACLWICWAPGKKALDLFSLCKNLFILWVQVWI